MTPTSSFTSGNKMSRSLICVFAFSCFAVPALGEKNVTIEPKLAKVTSPAVNESFDGELAKTFKGVKGEWKIVEGALVGKELATDEHAAVMNFQKKNRDSVVRFSFKLDGKTKGFNFSLNHKGGHLFRSVVSASKLTINLDKDKKDPTSKAIVMASEKGKFQQGKWYTMQIEMVGDHVVVQTDNGITAEANHEKLKTDKPNYRFVMRGDGLSIDDLKVWDVK